MNFTYEKKVKRGCGFRKIGGLYLAGDGMGVTCHRMPLPLHVCPVCSSGFKYARSWTWILPTDLFTVCDKPISEADCHKVTCRACLPPNGKHGLLWIGKKFYTPQSFIAECESFGISKRISTVPHDFVLGETWVYLAHIEAAEHVIDGPGELESEGGLFPVKRIPGVFYLFKPKRIEKIITEKQLTDLEELDRLAKRGITPVVVPDDDPDHQGNAHDKDED